MQQRKRNPWEQKRLPPSATQKKNRKTIWPWIIAGAIASLILLLVAITTIAHSSSTSTPHTTRATATPTSPTQGLEQFLLQVAQNSHPSGTSMTSKYNPNDKSLLIQETLGVLIDNASTKATIEHDCFVIQRAIWKSNIELTIVVVSISAPGIDQQGNVITGRAGLCELKDQTERSFNWKTLTPHQAWISYDGIWLHPTLN